RDFRLISRVFRPPLARPSLMTTGSRLSILSPAFAHRDGLSGSTNVRETPMTRMKASDFPQPLLELFDEYVHGGISRREFMDGAQKFAVGGMTAAALFEALKPNYALAME